MAIDYTGGYVPGGSSSAVAQAIMNTPVVSKSTKPSKSKPSSSAPSGANYNNLFSSLLAKALGLYNTPNPAANDLINPQGIIGGLSGSLINPNQIGNDAGLAYDAEIQALQNQQQQQAGLNATALKNIQDWFTGLIGTQKNATADDAAALSQAVASNKDSTNAFISAIGGNASQGAGLVGSAGAIAGAGLLGQGQAQANFDNNMVNVLGLAGEQAAANQQQQGNLAIQNILNQITQAQGQKAGAMAQARDQAQMDLFGQKSQLASLAANLEGNLYNEQMGLRQSKQTDLSNLSNMILASAMAPSQIQNALLGNQLGQAKVTQAGLQNQALQAEINAYTNGGSGSNTSISSAPLKIRQGILTQVTTPGWNFINTSGGLKVAPSTIKGQIKSYLTSLGLTNDAALNQYVNQLYAQVATPARVAAYNKAHPPKTSAGTTIAAPQGTAGNQATSGPKPQNPRVGQVWINNFTRYVWNGRQWVPQP